MRPGDLLAAKYRLERVLGSGGMGEVWAAVNESTRRPVAVKLMHSPTPDLRTRMIREAKAGGTLRHKNICDLYDIGETETGDPFLVMERLSGETVGERLARVGAFSATTAAEITGAIAAALRAAHAKGIIHRDIKPANVFLHREPDGDEEVVKVLDFGVAKHLLDATGTMTAGLVGSPAYASPEQACAEPTIDARSDLWSLGVVLFEMLTGRRPFPATSPYILIVEVVNGPIPSIAAAVPGLSPMLVRVVERCLTRDIDARVQSADEVLRLLGPFFDVTPWSHPAAAAREAAPVASQPQQPAPPDSDDWSRRSESDNAPTIVLPQGQQGPSSTIVLAAPKPPPPIVDLPPPRPSKAVAGAVAAAAISVIAVSVVGLLWASPGTDEQTATAPTVQAPEPARSAAPVEPPAGPTATASAAPVAAPAPAPVAAPATATAEPRKAPAPASAEPAAAATSTAPSATAAPHTDPVVHVNAAHPATAAAHQDAHHPARDCNPPYVIDEQGHRQYKRECL